MPSCLSSLRLQLPRCALPAGALQHLWIQCSQNRMAKELSRSSPTSHHLLKRVSGLQQSMQWLSCVREEIRACTPMQRTGRRANVALLSALLYLIPMHSRGCLPVQNTTVHGSHKVNEVLDAHTAAQPLVHARLCAGHPMACWRWCAKDVALLDAQHSTAPHTCDSTVVYSMIVALKTKRIPLCMVKYPVVCSVKGPSIKKHR